MSCRVEKCVIEVTSTAAATQAVDFDRGCGARGKKEEPDLFPDHPTVFYNDSFEAETKYITYIRQKL